MYIIIMNNYKNLTTTKRVDLYEGDNLVDKIRFLFPQTYNNISLENCIVHLNYRDLTGKEQSEILVKDNELYKDRLSYRYSIDSKFTEFYGDILFDISFSVTDDTDGDGTTENVLFHTESHIITIKPRPNSIAPDEIIPEDSASKILKEVHKLEERVTEFEENGVGGKDVVKYVEQTLTEEEKAQARKNIDAISTNDVLTKTNSEKYVPQSDYHPATKKYVDEIESKIPKKTSELENNSNFITDEEISTQLSEHNSSSASHADIRNLINSLVEKVNAILDSEDVDLDQLSELVSYIKSNRTLIEEVTTNKVNVSDIIDNLTTNASNKPLSAKQGMELRNLIDKLPTVPTTLPNPHKLKFSGVVNEEYDGSEEKIIEIPEISGEDGFSPIATVEQTDEGVNISIEDKNGTTTASVYHGKDGNTPFIDEEGYILYGVENPSSTVYSKLEIDAMFASLVNGNEVAY